MLDAFLFNGMFTICVHVENSFQLVTTTIITTDFRWTAVHLKYYKSKVSVQFFVPSTKTFVHPPCWVALGSCSLFSLIRNGPQGN
jgi:hypothetical protein